MGAGINRSSGAEPSYPKQAAARALNRNPETGQPLPKKGPMMTGQGLEGFIPDKALPEEAPRDKTLLLEQKIKDQFTKAGNTLEQSLRKHERLADLGRKGEFNQEYREAFADALPTVGVGYVKVVTPVAAKAIAAQGLSRAASTVSNRPPQLPKQEMAKIGEFFKNVPGPGHQAALKGNQGFMTPYNLNNPAQSGFKVTSHKYGDIFVDKSGNMSVPEGGFSSFYKKDEIYREARRMINETLDSSPVNYWETMTLTPHPNHARYLKENL